MRDFPRTAVGSTLPTEIKVPMFEVPRSVEPSPNPKDHKVVYRYFEQAERISSTLLGDLVIYEERGSD